MGVMQNRNSLKVSFVQCGAQNRDRINFQPQPSGAIKSIESRTLFMENIPPITDIKGDDAMPSEIGIGGQGHFRSLGLSQVLRRVYVCNHSNLEHSLPLFDLGAVRYGVNANETKLGRYVGRLLLDDDDAGLFHIGLRGGSKIWSYLHIQIRTGESPKPDSAPRRQSHCEIDNRDRGRLGLVSVGDHRHRLERSCQ